MAELTTNLNYLQPTGFKVSIDRENYPNLEFFCQGVSHPDITLAAGEMPFRKIRNIPIPGGELDFGELTLDTIVDEDMEAYKEMNDWMRRILDNPLLGPLERSDNAVPSTADITLTVLNSHNNKTRSIKYQECTPTTLGGIQFTSTASGTEYLTCQMSFRFIDFELV